MPGKLGLIAGGGTLPRRIIEACHAQGRAVFVVALDGQTDAATLEGDVPHIRIRMGAAGKAVKALRGAECEELVLAGPVRRPSFSELRPDLTAARFLSRVGAKALGDDGLLRAVMDLLEEEGFRVIGVHDILGDILASEGVWGREQPDEDAWRDIRRGLQIAGDLGRQDIGQAVVVQQGIVLGVEAIEGTDRLLQRCGELRRPGPGGVLVKIKKPGQDDRADLPTVGRHTVEGAAKAGLRGIAVEAGATIVMEPDDLVAAADAAGLFVVGVAVDKG
ncbi:LpxI family protein [Ferruginivarius sediminum]|uniref:LpxI family protein n=1 Tax=Ferruginivarius sediminum TaxID=2661937 RepID=A0A369TD92_9PROT|nr:UDP-2,3-diacylglucosamine diphosphatase LpxI [Ferruginivarius sediminum]RDD62127.1 LpxI family protein [Ferruginivarius sediminum]